MNRVALFFCLVVTSLITFVPGNATADGLTLKAQLCTRTGTPVKQFPVIVEGRRSFNLRTSDKHGQFVMQIESPGSYQIKLPNMQEPVGGFNLIVEKGSWYDWWAKERVIVTIKNDELRDIDELKLDIKVLPSGRGFDFDGTSIVADTNKGICSFKVGSPSAYSPRSFSQ